MGASEKGASLRELGLSTFSRVKDLVRQLEDDERRLSADLGPSEIEFKLKLDEVAWYVAYKTSAESLGMLTPRETVGRGD